MNEVRCIDQYCDCCNYQSENSDNYNYFHIILNGMFRHEILKEDYKRLEWATREDSFIIKTIESIDAPSLDLLIDKNIPYVITMSIDNDYPTEEEWEMYKDSIRFQEEFKNKIV